jgi:hypothetical protein
LLARDSEVEYLPPRRSGKVSAKILVIYTTGRRHKTDRSKAEIKVRRGQFYWLDKFTIEEVAVRFQPIYSDGSLGVGNALPFTRIQNKLCSPLKLHYCIPQSGAHMRLMRCSAINAENEIASQVANTTPGLSTASLE